MGSGGIMRLLALRGMFRAVWDGVDGRSTTTILAKMGYRQKGNPVEVTEENEGHEIGARDVCVVLCHGNHKPAEFARLPAWAVTFRAFNQGEVEFSERYVKTPCAGVPRITGVAFYAHLMVRRPPTVLVAENLSTGAQLTFFELPSS